MQATAISPAQIEALRGILAQVEMPADSISIQELWAKYAAFKKSQITHSTWEKGFVRTSAHVNRCPFFQLSDARAIADWLIENTSPDTARRQLTQLAAACNWALKRQLVAHNPFKGMAKEVKAKSYKLDCQPFTEHERRQIVNAYEQHPQWSKYAPLIKFVFLTGCRTSEALGLRWKSVASDFSSIKFCEACVLGKWKLGTKTENSRLFPCSAALSALLASLKPVPCNPEAPVFSDAGQPLSFTCLANSWRGKRRSHRADLIGVVEQLAADGAIACYRSQYHTRHTFITECLGAGIPVKVVAMWVGNSPEIIYKHYAGCGGDYQPPELL